MNKGEYNMVNDKLIAVDEETHTLVGSLKLIPKEPYGDCLKRVLGEYKKLKDKESNPIRGYPSTPVFVDEAKELSKVE